MDVIENFIPKEGPLFAPMWCAAQFHPLLSYVMKELHVGLSASKANDFNESCVGWLVHVSLNRRAKQAVRFLDDPYIQSGTEWIWSKFWKREQYSVPKLVDTS